MKHFDRVLTDKLLQDIRTEVSERHNEEEWRGSFSWSPDLTKGYFTNCLSKTIVGEMRERILKEIQPLITFIINTSVANQIHHEQDPSGCSSSN